MSTTVSLPVACPACGVEASILLVESANVQRRPAYREEVLAGRFMRFDCPSCGDNFIVERDVLYTDFEDRLFCAVFPRQRRGEAEELQGKIAEVFRSTHLHETPAIVRGAIGELRCRIAFGYEELRDKVVCFRAGLDDRIVDAIKRAILRAEPRAGVVGLSLQHVEDDGSLLLAAIDGDGWAAESEAALVRVPAGVYQELAAEVRALAPGEAMPA